MEIPPYEESKDVIQRKLDQTTMILQNINAYFLLIDKDFIVCDTNYYSLNKLPAPEVGMTQKVGDLLHCRNAAEAGECGMHQQCKLCGIRAAIGRAFHKKESFQKVNASMNLLNDKEDKVIPCDVSVSGAYVVINGEDHMVLTVYDVTELQNVQRLLNIERKNSISAERLKSTFIANISHEVRTPLNAIVGFSALLAATEDMAEKELYNSLISHNNELLLELINDVLDLSKLESGYLELHPSWFNLAELLDESVAEYTRQLAAGVELRTHYLDQGFLVELDRLRIKQILNNFLSNALKNTTSGYVEVFYEIDSSYVRIGVRDTGRGIPQNMLEKIFERFEKVDSFTQGAGLGLPICKSIVDKMNGRIWADSQLGIGTTFMVELPCSVTPIDA